MTFPLTLLDLAGAIALLLWGSHMVQTGVQRAFGPQLKSILGGALRNRLLALFAGMGVTALLQGALAPPGSDRILDVIRVDVHGPPGGPPGGGDYFTVEYKIALPGRFERHNVSTFHVTGDGRLFTLNVQCPEAEWARDGALRGAAAAMAASLQVAGGDGGGGGLLGAVGGAL